MPLMKQEAIFCPCCEELRFIGDLNNITVKPCDPDGPWAGKEEVKLTYSEEAEDDVRVGDCQFCGFELLNENIT